MRYIKYLLLCVFAFVFCCMHAQTESETVKDSVMTCVQCDSLYNQACLNSSIIWGEPEHLTQFFGGTKELMTFLRNHIEYPLKCREQGIQGCVVIKFIIDESGKIICPYIYKSVHPALDKEALRVVKSMPDWEPASNDNVPCKACFSLPILFRL